VYEAYLRVKAKKGAAGSDEESLEEFEKDWKNNLYQIWNRMSSGSYHPPSVRAVAIPKKNGGTRILGVPTVSDRIAQTVVKMVLESQVEPQFHTDSYAYRPMKSALDAVGVARKRCWKYDWVIDLDIRSFFDTLDHELVMKAVRHHTKERWILLYVERWLKAPTQMEDGRVIGRDKGSPQGSVISPLLANLFMHYAFDGWMSRQYPDVPFERYADDSLVHCASQKQAQEVLGAIKARLEECKLELNMDKTHIVYCKDVDRIETYTHEQLDFLGFTFRPRLSKSKYGKCFVSFTPAISTKAAREVRAEIRRWGLHLRSDKKLEDLAQMFNTQVQGWVNYYGRFYKSALYPSLRNIERYLIRWVTRKYKRFRGHKSQAKAWLGGIARREPSLFAHWRLGLRSSAES